MDLSSFPGGLRATVFKYLPLDDRKSVRLTCQSWYDDCSLPEIIKREKFVIRFDCNQDDVACIAVCLANCERLRSIFEFQGFPLQRLPGCVWKSIGDKINSLLIYECEVNDETIIDIFSHCSNLFFFRLQSSLSAYGNRDLVFCSQNALDGLIKRHVERKKLHTFKLYIPVHLEEELYRKLFQIFPNIRTLGRGHDDLSGLPGEQLEFAPMTQKFIYRSEADSSWLVPFRENPKLKFKVLDMKLAFLTQHQDTIVKDFFAKQTDLEDIKLSVDCSDEQTTEMKILLLHILKSTPKLKKFQFHTHCDICFSVAEFGDFLQQISRLETLSLVVGIRSKGYSVDGFFPVELYPSIVYTNLTTLRLSFYDKQFYYVILNRCRCLHYLHLENVPIWDLTLWIKLRCYKELRTLRLDFAFSKSSCDYYHDLSRSTKYPDHCFQNLRHLELRGVPLEKLEFQANLPNLQYFYFGSYHHSKCTSQELYDSLDTTLRKAPRLEILKVSGPLYLAWNKSDIFWEDIDQTISYCRKFQKLKSFIVNPFFPPEFYSPRQHPVEKLFAECPSLKFVCGVGRRLGNSLVCRDRISGTLKWYKHFKLETLNWYPNFKITKFF